MKWCIVRPTFPNVYHYVDEVDPEGDNVVAVFKSKKKAEKALDIADRAHSSLVADAETAVSVAEYRLREANRIIENCMKALGEQE